jgi:manganese/iron transport system permease protein
MMNAMVDILIDPLRDEAFVRALIDVVVVAAVAGVVGTFIVLRGASFLGDALAHAIFPGVVIAFLLDVNLLAGALVAGLVMAALMGVLMANLRVRGDTAIGVIFTAAFALGVMIITNRTIAGEELEHILFGDPLNATWTDVALTASIGGLVALGAVMLRHLFAFSSFDPSGARAMGLPVVALDVLLLVLTALTVVISFKAVGNILVISLVITPPATARLLTSRLLPTMLLAAAIGASAAVVGVYVGHANDVSSGGTIVLLATVAFFAAWLVAPRHGMLTSALERRRSAVLREQPEAVAEVILASSGIQAPHEH